MGSAFPAQTLSFLSFLSLLGRLGLLVLGLLRERDRVGGDVGADARDHRGAVTDRLKDHPDQAGFLLVGRRRRLAGGAVDDDSLTAHVVYEVSG